MLILAPSKGQNFDSLVPDSPSTIPELIDNTEVLVSSLRKFDVAGLCELMGVSEKIAQQNVDRFAGFSLPFSTANAKQALFAFTGDVYQQINVEEYSEKELAFAQTNLRILSGLYGCLRPLDLMQPYRLEMKTKLATIRGRDLYAFWGNRITEALNKAINDSEQSFLLNLASTEYVRAIKTATLKVPVIEVIFREIKEGKSRTIAIHAKRARGMMTDFIIRNHLTRVEDIKTFAGGGYTFAPALSEEQKWVYTRPQP